MKTNLNKNKMKKFGLPYSYLEVLWKGTKNCLLPMMQRNMLMLFALDDFEICFFRFMFLSIR